MMMKNAINTNPSHVVAMKNSLVRHSKFLSLVLRHKPETIGLTLDENGWATIADLTAGAAAYGRHLSAEQIREIVATNDKQRFALSEDGRRIRANQGHSIDVDVGLRESEPPAVLFHGTATRFLDSIWARGLLPGSRQHVHLSSEEATAFKVGVRHGRPVVLRVDASAARRGGQKFFLSKNGVWLTSSVAPTFLAKIGTDR